MGRRQSHRWITRTRIHFGAKPFARSSISLSSKPVAGPPDRNCDENPLTGFSAFGGSRNSIDNPAGAARERPGRVPADVQVERSTVSKEK